MKHILSDHDFGPALCSVDPITLGTLAITAIGAGASAYSASKSAKQETPAAAPMTAPPTAPPVQNPTGSAKAKTSAPPSFIGAAAAPDQRGFGQKTLIGQ